MCSAFDFPCKYDCNVTVCFVWVPCLIITKKIWIPCVCLWMYLFVNAIWLTQFICFCAFNLNSLCIHIYCADQLLLCFKLIFIHSIVNCECIYLWMNLIAKLGCLCAFSLVHFYVHTCWPIVSVFCIDFYAFSLINMQLHTI